MQERAKAQLTIGILAFFASVWILIDYARNYHILMDAVAIIIVLFIVMLVLSYILIAILEWINLFDLKTNAVITLIVLIGFLINFAIYLFYR
jgi:hypothetical protein